MRMWHYHAIVVGNIFRHTRSHGEKKRHLQVPVFMVLEQTHFDFKALLLYGIIQVS